MHSIDVEASIAELQASGALTSDGICDAPTAQDLEQMCAEFDEALLVESAAVDSKNARFFGSSSGRPELRKSADEEGGVAPPISILPRENHVSNVCSQLRSTQEHNISDELVEHLLGLYFQWEEPWQQVVNERMFRHSMQTNGRYFSPLLLNSILAMGSRYSDRIETRSDLGAPSTTGQIFLETAEELLQSDLKSPSLTTIQSLAVMAVTYVATGSDEAGWLHHGMAIRLALDMGFNLDPSILRQSYDLKPEECTLRRQIYWALYCTDKLWASYTGRICTVLDSQALVVLPTPAITNSGLAGAAAYDDNLLVTLHRALSTHCLTLEKILMNLYAPKKLRSALSRHSFFDSCLLELRHWKSRLPEELKLTSSNSQNKFPHAYTLNMVYHTSVILLAKPFVPKSPKPTVESMKAPSPSNEIAGKAADLCSEATRQIYLLGEQYREVFGSFRKSPITATHCTLSAALVILRLRCRPRQKAEGRYIGSFLTTLKELSDAWIPAERYWSSLHRIVSGDQQNEKEEHTTNAALEPGQYDGTATFGGASLVASQEAAHELSQLVDGSITDTHDWPSYGMPDEYFDFGGGDLFPQNGLILDSRFWPEGFTEFTGIGFLGGFDSVHDQH
ncbi:fungal-specific transcription factor domain-containing protein [Aspergillus heterothallicus]